eukprot:scaffold143389_cov17-Tisochrysis_lutea.AAC.1
MASFSSPSRFRQQWVIFGQASHFDWTPLLPQLLHVVPGPRSDVQAWPSNCHSRAFRDEGNRKAV